MSRFTHIAAAIAVSVTGVSVFTPSALAQNATGLESVEQELSSGSFIKKKKKLKGAWEVVRRGDKIFIVFGDDFRAANGPDLKIFLSPQTVSEVTGKTAINGSVNIGELKATKGSQEYEVPAGISLSDYSSVLVHCEAYSVLWGGGDLN
ncbi:MAG: DM13 domain-containing protein [Henriciella sp.]|nr:DM13 domain-containing protein [Henriciella sp.]